MSSLLQHLQIKYPEDNLKFAKSVWIPPKQSEYNKESTQYLKSHHLQQKYMMLSDGEQSQPSENRIKTKIIKLKKDQKKAAKKIIYLNTKPKLKKSSKDQKDRLHQLKYTQPKTFQINKQKVIKKRNSLGNQKKSVFSKELVDVDISKQILKNKIHQKEKEIFKYKDGFEKLKQITQIIQQYGKLSSKSTIENSISYIKKIIENQIKSIFPVISKLIQSILCILQTPLVSYKTHSSSNTFNSDYPLSPTQVQTTMNIKSDIQKLERELKHLKSQSFKLQQINSITQQSGLKQQLQQHAILQKQQIIKLLKMEQQLEKYKDIEIVLSQGQNKKLSSCLNCTNNNNQY